MVPSKMEKITSKPVNKYKTFKNNIIPDYNIPYPRQVDKESLKENILNSYNIEQLKEIQALHQENVNNYKKGDVCELVYSEEEYNDDNKFISYDKLLELIYIKEPFDKNKFKNFKYKNYNPDNELLFSSNFESGNLRYAIKLNSNEYDLILRPETDCTRTYHWFFF